MRTHGLRVRVNSSNARRFHPLLLFPLLALAGLNLTAQGSLQVTLVGTGSPQFNPDRSGPSAMVSLEGVRILVDMGTGTQARLNSLGLSPRDLDFICFTHHHVDHDAEFPAILVQAVLGSRLQQVVGPPGTARLVEFHADFYREDLAYRGRLTGSEPRKVPVRDLKGGECFSLGNLQVRTAQVHHTIHTLAYRFDAQGRSIVISGDLSPSSALVELAKGADVLVIDGSAAASRGPRGAARSGSPAPAGAAGGGEERRDRPGRAHSSLPEVAAMAAEAGVKRLVLTHFGPGAFDEAAARSILAQTFKGDIVFGRDLATF